MNEKVLLQTGKPGQKKGPGLLQTAGRLREVVPASGKVAGSLSLHELTDGQWGKLTDKEYALKFGKDEDFDYKHIREVIIERRKRIPAYSFWICKKCGKVVQDSGDRQEGGRCIYCNMPGYVDGGFMRRMSEAEVKEYQKKEAEYWAKINEQNAAAEFFMNNQSRQKMGLEPQTRAEYDAEKAARWEATLKARREEPERQRQAKVDFQKRFDEGMKKQHEPKKKKESSEVKA